MTSLAPTETSGPPPTESGPPRRAPRRLSLNPRQSGIYVAFALIVALFAVLTDGALLQPQNISNIIVQNSYILILAIGMILIIIAGHIDLSAGSVVAATGAVSAVLMVNMDLPWPLAVLITLLVGAAIGAFQGYWVAYFGIPAFIVTLAGMLVFRAVTLTVLGNQGIGPFPEAVRTLANGFTPGFLGNIGLGPLGGADVVTLLLGLGRGRPRSRRRSGGPARPGSATARRSTRSRCSSSRSSRRPRWSWSWWCSWPASATCPTC